MTGPDPIRAPWWLKHANQVLVVLLRLGVPVSRHESPVVLTAPGRRTGKLRSTPVTPMHVDGKRYVVNGYPGADWVGNVRAAERVTLTQGRLSEAVRMVELSADDARPILRQFPVLVSTGVDIMKRAGVLKTGTPEELAGLAGRLPVFRIDPVT
jgi:deazaflavin-dependent oxidoreductase (nitroreductase family)